MLLLTKIKSSTQKYWLQVAIYHLREVSKYLKNAGEPMMSMRVSSMAAEIEHLNNKIYDY
jgi:hypothetical protein